MKKTLLLVALVLLAACRSEPATDAGAPPGAPSPSEVTPSRVLVLSDREVLPGQVVKVTFSPPPDHDVWGVSGELWQDREGVWKRIGWISGWAGKPKMSTYFPSDENFAFPDVGFTGSSSWKWRVPVLLEAGSYELRKEWLPKAPPSPDRPVVLERAPFTVTEGT